MPFKNSFLRLFVVSLTMATKTNTTTKPAGPKSPAKSKAAKSNIRIGSLMGKIKVAPDAWDDDLRKTVAD
jgi:hypothetical protein